MYSIKTVMCVIAGYNVTNVSFEQAKSIGEKEAEAVGIKDFKVFPIIMSYPHRYGAPDGGEIGFSLECVCKDKEEILTKIKKIAFDLGQIDSAVLFYKNSELVHYSYLHIDFAKDQYIADAKANIFSIDLNENASLEYLSKEEDIFALSAKLQERLDKQDYPISIRIQKEEDGSHLLVIQNPYQGNNDRSLFEHSVTTFMLNFPECKCIRH